MKFCCHPLKKKKKKEKPKICRRALSIVVSLSRQADRFTSGSCSRCSSKSSFKDHSYQLSPGRMKQLLCLLNPKKFKTHWGKILPCLTNIIRHKIFSLSRIPSHDVQINISDRLSPESDFASEHLRSCFFSSSEFFFFFLFFFSFPHGESSSFSGPRICSNLQHGSVGWQQDAQEIVPKKLWADLHIIPDHPVDTHGAFLLLFFFCFHSPLCFCV